MGKASRQPKKNLRLADAKTFQPSLPWKSLSRPAESTACSSSTSNHSDCLDKSSNSAPISMNDSPSKSMTKSMTKSFENIPERVGSPSTVTTAATGGTDMWSNSSSSSSCQKSTTPSTSSSSLTDVGDHTEKHQQKLCHSACSSSTCSKMTGPCTCQTIQGDIHEINLFLPKCLPCICRQHLRTLEEHTNGNPPNPDELMNLPLEKIVRPWQDQFLKSVGIVTVTDLARGYKEYGSDLSKCMRKWCKRHKIWVPNQKSCFLALHIWTRTCQNLEHILNVTYDLTYPTKPVRRLPAHFYGFTDITHSASAGGLPSYKTELPSRTVALLSRSKAQVQRPTYDPILVDDKHLEEDDEEDSEVLGPDDEWWKIQPKIEQQLRELEELEQKRQRRLAVENALTFKDTRWESLAEEEEACSKSVASTATATSSVSSSSKSSFQFRLPGMSSSVGEHKKMKSQSERGERRSAAFRGLYDKMLENLQTEATDADDYSIYHKALKETKSRRSLKNGHLHATARSTTNSNYSGTSSCDGSQLSLLSTEDELASTFCSSGISTASTVIDEEEIGDNSEHTHDTYDYEVELLTQSQDKKKVDEKSYFTKGGRRRIYMEDWEDDDNADNLSITDDTNIIESLTALSSKRRLHPWDTSLKNRVVEDDTTTTKFLDAD